MTSAEYAQEIADPCRAGRDGVETLQWIRSGTTGRQVTMEQPPATARRLPRATLEIVGHPGEVVSVFPETRLDAPPSAIFDGTIPVDGCLRLRVPKSPLLVVVSGFGKAAVTFGEGETFRRLDARPPDSESSR